MTFWMTFKFARLLCLIAVFAFSSLQAAFAESVHDFQERFSFDLPTGWSLKALGPEGVTGINGAGAYANILRVPGGARDQTLVKHVTEQAGREWKSFNLNSRGTTKLGGHPGADVFFTGLNSQGVFTILRVIEAPVGEDAYMMLLSAPSADFFSLKEAFKQIQDSFTLTSGNRSAATKNLGPARDAPTGFYRRLPGRTVGNGFQSADGTVGGRILFRALPRASSAKDVTQAGMGLAREYFDTSPQVLNAVVSKDRTVLIAAFSASLQSVPISGLAVSIYDRAGHSCFAIVFDSPDHLKTSLAPMMSRVHQIAEASQGDSPNRRSEPLDFAGFEAASSDVTLIPTVFPDGTATVGVAAGFTPRRMRNASFFANTADGAYIKVLGNDSMLDPAGSLYRAQQAGGKSPASAAGRICVRYTSDPVEAWKKYLAEMSRQQGSTPPNVQVENETSIPKLKVGWTGKFVSGKVTIDGELYAFTGTLITGPPPSPEGYWQFSETILAAPIKNAKVDFPALFAMEKSFKLDPNAIRDEPQRNAAQINVQTMRWVAGNIAAGEEMQRRRFERPRSAMKAACDAIDRSATGIVQRLPNVSVVEQDSAGARSLRNKSLAGALEQADPQNFSVVPISIYLYGLN